MMTLRAGGGRILPGTFMQRPGSGAGGHGGHSLYYYYYCFSCYQFNYLVDCLKKKR